MALNKGLGKTVYDLCTHFGWSLTVEFSGCVHVFLLFIAEVADMMSFHFAKWVSTIYNMLGKIYVSRIILGGFKILFASCDKGIPSLTYVPHLAIGAHHFIDTVVQNIFRLTKFFSKFFLVFVLIVKIFLNTFGYLWSLFTHIHEFGIFYTSFVGLTQCYIQLVLGVKNQEHRIDHWPTSSADEWSVLYTV